MDVLGSIDPFIQFYLSSDSRQRLTLYGPKLQTSVKKNAPYRAEWNEFFLFGIDEPASFKLDLMDWDRTGTEKVGESIVSIDEVFKLMQSRMGSETTLNLPVLNDSKPVLGRDNIPCCLIAKLRILRDEKKTLLMETQKQLSDSQVYWPAVSAARSTSSDVVMGAEWTRAAGEAGTGEPALLAERHPPHHSRPCFPPPENGCAAAPQYHLLSSLLLP